jgi:hypothetical protein
MDQDRDFAGFIKWVAASLAIGMVLAIAFVALVDPYRLHRLVERDGFNMVKPRPQHYLLEIKQAGARAARPQLFLMGNSRIDVGIDPDSGPLGATAYNLALPGTGVGTSRHQFMQLVDSGVRPATLLLGVEFFDFLLDPESVETPDRAMPDGLARQRWKIDTLFSLEALLDAARTLAIQHDPDAATMSARGFNSLADYLRPARQDGYHAFFQQRALENARKFSLAPRGVVLSRSDSSADWRELGRLLDAAARQRTDIQLVIYPYHAQLMAMLEQTGLWPAFEQWKLRLLREIARVNLAYPQARIVLWDFSGYGAFQCERIPPKGDLAATTWYWESGHFKAALGEMMLARVFGPVGTVPVAPDFGVRLDQASWRANRERIARERRACQASEPAMFREAAAMVAAFRAQRSFLPSAK